MGLQGAVLAAGLGTRLRPLTNNLPKPLVPMAGRPLITYSLDHLAQLGVSTIGVNTHYLSEFVAPKLSGRSEDIYVVHEDQLQGTGGGIREIARARPGQTIVAINGDALFDFELNSALTRHYERKSIGTLILRYVPPDAPFGRVGVDGIGRLHRVAEIEAPGADSLTLFYGAYTGVQIIEPELIARIPEGECDILRTAYRDEMSDSGRVFGDFVPPNSIWLDVGNVERYLSAHWAILDGEFPVHHLPCSDTQGRRISESAHVSEQALIQGPCVIMPGAEISAGAVVGPYAFVDREAKVMSGASVNHAVIWPGVCVGGQLKQTVAIASD